MTLKVLCSSLVTTGAAYCAYRNYQNYDLRAEDFTVNTEQVNLEKPARIAVIGTGIGGASASYFLSKKLYSSCLVPRGSFAYYLQHRKSFGSSVEIHAYERESQVGGRMRTVELNGNEIEAGGTIIQDSNKYMLYFINELGLKPVKAMDKVTLGIWDGKEFVFKENESRFITRLNMLWRYGFLSLWNLRRSLYKLLIDFGKIYTIQDDGNAFETVPDLLRAMGGERFFNYTQHTAKEIMKENGLGDLLIVELITAITRYTYEQNTSMNGLTGYLAMAGGAGGALWSVKGGNYSVCEKLLENAEVNVHFNKNVKSIQKKLHAGGKSAYFIETEDDAETERAYDSVIVAAPLEVPSCYFNCNECSDWPNQATLGHYQQRFATFIQAYRNIKNFGAKSKDELPDAVCTTEAMKFSMLLSLKNTMGEEINPPVYRVYSREKLSSETIKTIFEISGETKVKDYSWLACPQYVAPERFTPLKLDDGVFYVNGIERVATGMEMSAIGGRNAALLTKNYLTSM